MQPGTQRFARDLLESGRVGFEGSPALSYSSEKAYPKYDMVFSLLARRYTPHYWVGAYPQVHDHVFLIASNRFGGSFQLTPPENGNHEGCNRD